MTVVVDGVDSYRHIDGTLVVYAAIALSVHRCQSRYTSQRKRPCGEPKLGFDLWRLDLWRLDL